MGCRSNENEINNAATELANIIISAANKSLKRRNFTKNKKKNKSKKYFDTDLQILRKSYLAVVSIRAKIKLPEREMRIHLTTCILATSQ
jgi:hypothetical protein